jgi:hypothetical protein
MQPFGGYFPRRTPSNAIATLAQIFLRIKPFTAQLPKVALQACQGPIPIFLDLYTQMSAKEAKLDVNPLIQNFPKLRTGPVDIIDSLQHLLFQFDASSRALSKLFISRDGTEAVPFFSLGLATYEFDVLLMSTVQGLSDVAPFLFVHCQTDTLSLIPASVRKVFGGDRPLFAVVCEPREKIYCLYIKDSEGWLSIQDSQIKRAVLYDRESAVLLVYTNDASQIETIRYPAPAAKSLVVEVQEFDASTMKCQTRGETFQTPSDCIAYLSTTRDNYPQHSVYFEYQCDDGEILPLAKYQTPVLGFQKRIRLFVSLSAMDRRFFELFRRAPPVELVFQFADPEQFDLPVMFHRDQTAESLHLFVSRIAPLFLKFRPEADSISLFVEENKLEKTQVTVREIAGGSRFVRVAIRWPRLLSPHLTFSDKGPGDEVRASEIAEIDPLAMPPVLVVAHMFLRIIPFTEPLRERRSLTWGLAQPFGQFYEQMKSKVVKIDPAPLLERYRGNSQDIIEFLSDFIRDLWVASGRWKKSFASPWGDRPMLVLQEEVQDLALKVQLATPVATDRPPFIFIGLRNSRSQAIPANVRLPSSQNQYSLFAVVCQAGANHFALFFSDAKGWLSIQGQEISPVVTFDSNKAVLLAYTSDPSQIECIRDEDSPVQHPPPVNPDSAVPSIPRLLPRPASPLNSGRISPPAPDSATPSARGRLLVINTGSKPEPSGQNPSQLGPIVSVSSAQNPSQLEPTVSAPSVQNPSQSEPVPPGPPAQDASQSQIIAPGSSAQNTPRTVVALRPSPDTPVLSTSGDAAKEPLDGMPKSDELALIADSFVSSGLDAAPSATAEPPAAQIFCEPAGPRGEFTFLPSGDRFSEVPVRFTPAPEMTGADLMSFIPVEFRKRDAKVVISVVQPNKLGLQVLSPQDKLTTLMERGPLRVRLTYPRYRGSRLLPLVLLTAVSPPRPTGLVCEISLIVPFCLDSPDARGARRLTIAAYLGRDVKEVGVHTNANGMGATNAGRYVNMGKFKAADIDFVYALVPPV